MTRDKESIREKNTRNKKKKTVDDRNEMDGDEEDGNNEDKGGWAVRCESEQDTTPGQHHGGLQTSRIVKAVVDDHWAMNCWLVRGELQRRALGQTWLAQQTCDA